MIANTKTSTSCSGLSAISPFADISDCQSCLVFLFGRRSPYLRIDLYNDSKSDSAPCSATTDIVLHIPRLHKGIREMHKSNRTATQRSKHCNLEHHHVNVYPQCNFQHSTYPNPEGERCRVYPHMLASPDNN